MLCSNDLSLSAKLVVADKADKISVGLQGWGGGTLGSGLIRLISRPPKFKPAFLGNGKCVNRPVGCLWIVWPAKKEK